MTYTIGDLAPRLQDLATKVAGFAAEDEVPRPLIDPLCEIERWADKHTNDPRNRSCIDRIEEQAKSNEETFGWMVNREHDYADDDRSLEEIFDESPLAVTREGTKVTVEESWGGPSDGYEFELSDGSMDNVQYYFRDWFDGAWLEIDEDDYPYTWQYLEYLSQYAAALEEDE